MKNLIASLIALLGLGSLFSDPTAHLEQIDADAACAVAYASLARAETPQPPVPVESPKSQVSAIVKQCHPGCTCGPQCECNPCDGITCPCARERKSVARGPTTVEESPHSKSVATTVAKPAPDPTPPSPKPPQPQPGPRPYPVPQYQPASAAPPLTCQPGMPCYGPAQRVLRPAPAVQRTWGWRRR